MATSFDGPYGRIILRPSPSRLDATTAHPYIQWLGALPPEKRAVVDRQGLDLCDKLLGLIKAHSAEHPDVPNDVWFHGVNALYTAMEGLLYGERSQKHSP